MSVSEVNPLQVMLQPVLQFLQPWVTPVTQVIAALALLYCLLLTARVFKYPRSDAEHEESRKKSLRSLRNGVISSLLVIALSLALRWGLLTLGDWIGL